MLRCNTSIKPATHISRNKKKQFSDKSEDEPIGVGERSSKVNFFMPCLITEKKIPAYWKFLNQIENLQTLDKENLKKINKDII